MQVFISDLHLTDGTSGETINAAALRVFAENLEALMSSMDKKAKGSATELQVVLLGDIFDVIRSAYWLDEMEVRPWSPRGDEQERVVLHIVQVILDKNRETISLLTRLSKLADKRKIPFRINYVIGNHDWLINRYPSCRDAVASALGMQTPAATFKEDIFDAAYGTYATHGDKYDSMNYMKSRDESSVGDAIVIELLNRFPVEAEEGLAGLVASGQLAAEERKRIVDQLKELDNIRPLLDAPSWVLKVLDGTASQAARDVIIGAWKACADRFFLIPFIKSLDVPYWPDKMNLLQLLFKAVAHGSIPMLEEITGKLKKLFFLSGEDAHYSKKANEERLLHSGQASFVVYGHTHNHVIVPLDQVQTADGKAQDRIYFNTGTWRQTWNKAIFEPAGREFIGWKVLTYVSFYNDHENSDYSFEVWNGALGKGNGNI
jgi:UDP-2,3-diacylglucosamine pyrophosphatase LpxH